MSGTPVGVSELPQNEYCTPRSAAKWLGITTARIMRWIEEYDLRRVVLPGTDELGRARYLIHWPTLQQFIKDRELPK